MLNYIEKKIRSNIFYYILFISLYKKITFLFYFIEIKNYRFLKKIKKKFLHFKILNIGSNYGQISKKIQFINNLFKIVNFEPNFYNINIKKKDPFIKNHIIGAYSRNIKKKLFIPYYNKYPLDSLASLDKNHILSYLKQNKINITKISFKIIKCKLFKIDNFKYKTFFIKIDVEGSELDALKGLKKTLKKYNPIILCEKNQKSISKIITFLKKYKYKMYVFQSNEFKKANKFSNLNDIFFLNEKSFNYLV